MSSLCCSIFFYHYTGCQTQIVWIWLGFRLMSFGFDNQAKPKRLGSGTVSKLKSLRLGMVSRPKYLGLYYFLFYNGTKDMSFVPIELKKEDALDDASLIIPRFQPPQMLENRGS